MNNNENYDKERKKVERFIQRKGLKMVLYRTILSLVPTRLVNKIKFQLNVGGGSYTNGETIVVGVPEYFWSMGKNEILSATKALTGHETEHVLSSDFKLFVEFQKKISSDFTKYGMSGKLAGVSKSFEPPNANGYDQRRANILEGFGRKLGAHLLNSVEDGRIEKRHANRRRGMEKHIKFLNAVIWDKQPVKGKDTLTDFLFCITSLSVTGLKSKNWDTHYAGTEQDKVLNDIKPLIIRGINEPTAKGCADRTYEIFLKIAPVVRELLEEDLTAIRDLIEQFDFRDTTAPEDGEVGTGNSVSTHIQPMQQEDSDTKESNQSSSQQGESSNNPSSEENKGQQETNNDQKSDSKDKDNGSGESEESSTEEESEGDSQLSSKEEKDLVSSFLNDVKDDLEEDVKDDLNAMKEEEERLKAEEKRKEKESGDLQVLDIESVITGTKASGFNQRTIEPDVMNAKETPIDIASKGKILRKKLEKVLLNRATPTRKHQKRGYLDRNNLYKVGMKDFEVFEKKGKPNTSTYVVSVIVDRSGSMMSMVKDGKNKMSYAVESCAVIEEALKGLVPLRINFFDDYLTVNHTRVLDFGDRNRKVNHTINAEVRPGGGNADSISIRIATKELLKRSETKKLLIVLSDGLPASYYDANDAITSVKNAVRDARKEGVQVISIGFGNEEHLAKTEDGYREMYQRGLILTTPENIPEHLAKVIEREIK